MNQKGFVKDVIIIVLGVLLLGGGYFYFSKKPAYAPAENIKRNQIADETKDWKTYRNYKYGFEFKYPSYLGDVVDNGENGYVINSIDFSNQEYNKIFLDTFTAESVKKVEDYISKRLENNESIGDPGFPDFPLTVDSLLKSKPAGYDCTKDMGEDYLTKDENEVCTIGDINGSKAFVIIAEGPHGSEDSKLKYVFFKKGIWLDFTRDFWVYDKENPSKMIYSYKELNGIIQGKKFDPNINKEVEEFKNIMETIKFY